MKKLFTLLALMVVTIAAYGYTDVVSPGYKPAGEKFIETKTIDWNSQKIVTSIDVSSCTGDLEDVLSVGSNIENFYSNGCRFHLYYTRSTKTLVVKFLNGGSKSVDKTAKVDKDELIVEISQEKGITVNGEDWNNGVTISSTYTDLFALTSVQIGSQEGSNRSNATYNYVRLYDILSPSITVSDDPAGTNVVDDNYSPNGSKFGTDKSYSIDWDSQELVACINVSGCKNGDSTAGPQNILSVGTDISNWNSASAIHLYYNRNTSGDGGTLEEDYLEGQSCIMRGGCGNTLNGDEIIIRISKTNGITVNGQNWNYQHDGNWGTTGTLVTGDDISGKYTALWNLSSIYVGSAEGKKTNSRSTATYNYIRVVDLNPTPVTLAESDDDSSSPISSNAGKKVASLVLTRTLVADEWNTFCVPFDVPASAMSGFGDMVIKKFQKVDGSKMYLQDAESIEAGQPYLIKPVANIQNPTFLNATISSTPAQSVGDGNYKFVGLYTTKTFDSEDTNTYILVSGGKLVNPSGGTMKGMRAYFTYTSSDPEAVAPRLVIDGVETAIAEVLGKEAVSDGRIYNLRGMYVGNDSSRLAKGVYIMNGKKVVLK